MHNIDEAFNKSNSFSDFSLRYFKYISEIHSKMDLDELDMFENEFVLARESGNTIFVAGNGGSAATATTMANDIGFDIIKKTGTEKPFRVFALTDNTSVITALPAPLILPNPDKTDILVKFNDHTKKEVNIKYLLK